jgi:hypothetical protein
MTTNLSQYTDLTIVGTGDDIAVLTELAKRAGVLVYRSAPARSAARDPRLRVTFRLHLHHR